jgi:hypothetical protein
MALVRKSPKPAPVGEAAEEAAPLPILAAA